jgi:hypothetical protein
MIRASFKYEFVPTVGTHGGILIACRTTVWSATNVFNALHSLTLKLVSS